MSRVTAQFSAGELDMLARALDIYAADASNSEGRAVRTLAGRLAALQSGRSTLRSRPLTTKTRPKVAKQKGPNWMGAGTHTVVKRKAKAARK